MVVTPGIYKTRILGGMHLFWQAVGLHGKAKRDATYYLGRPLGLLGLVARGKVRGTSAATPGMRMPRMFVRGAGVACTEAQHLPAAKVRNYR